MSKRKKQRIELVNRQGTIARPYEDVAEIWIQKGWKPVEEKPAEIAIEQESK